MDPPKILQKSQNVTRQILKEPFEGLFKSSRNIPLKIKKKTLKTSSIILLKNPGESLKDPEAGS